MNRENSQKSANLPNIKMTQQELDPQFVITMRLLHSSNKDSADQLRLMLDEAIRQKHGTSKMLCNVLHKKYMVEELVLSDHSSNGGGSASNQKSKISPSSTKHSSKSSKSNSPEFIPTLHESDIMQSDDTLVEMLEADLTCVVCKGMDVSAKNQLVECVECHSLYHQDCHVPHIADSQMNVPRYVWYCSKCTKTTQVPKEANPPKPPVPESKPKESKKPGKRVSKTQKTNSKKLK